MPKDQLPLPADEDVTFEKKSSVIVSGSRMTTCFEGPNWNKDRFVSELYRSVFDGRNSKSFHAPASEDLHPTGNINSIRMNQDADSNFCIPIQLAFRAFDPILGRYEEHKMQVIDEKSHIGNRECICVEEKKPAYVARCWVDPGRDYNVVRYAMVFDGFPDYQCDIEYTLHDNFGWIPQSWHNVLHNTNSQSVKLSYDRRASVTSFEINGLVEDQEFQLEFPPRTEVKDWINDQRFVVLDDGTKRFATQEENQRGITYEELLHPKHNTTLLAVAGIAAVGMVLGLLLLWARKKRRKPA
jgi:hypothetical protein